MASAESARDRVQSAVRRSESTRQPCFCLLYWEVASDDCPGMEVEEECSGQSHSSSCGQPVGLGHLVQMLRAWGDWISINVSYGLGGEECNAKK